MIVYARMCILYICYMCTIINSLDAVMFNIHMSPIYIEGIVYRDVLSMTI